MASLLGKVVVRHLNGTTCGGAAVDTLVVAREEDA